MATEGTVVWDIGNIRIVTSFSRTLVSAVAKLELVTSIRSIEISYAIVVSHLAAWVLVTEDTELRVVVRLNIGTTEHLIESPNVCGERRHSSS